MLRLLLVLAAWVLAAGPALAQPDPVRWTVTAEPTAAEPGDLVMVTLRGRIGGDWRMYAMDSEAGRPLRVQLDPPAGIEALGPPQQAQPQAGFDPNFNSDYTFFEGEATVTQAFRVTHEAPAASQISGAITYMVCNDEVCLPPRQQPVAVAIEVRRGATRESIAEAPPRAPPQAPPAASEPPPLAAEGAEREEAQGEDTEQGGGVLMGERGAEGGDAAVAEPLGALPPPDAGAGGLWAFLLLAVGAGLAALLTPCVFPMIPLTVSYFLHQSGDRRRAVRMAGAFGVSVVAIFTGLGLAMALVVGAAGPQVIAANPWVNLFIGAVLVVFGFSLLGFYELRLPGAWLNYFNRQGNERGGYAGVLFMGLTLTLVSFSCTVPFVGGLLAQAVRAEWAYPVLGMVVFSTVFAAPFVGFALFPRALSRLPKSGGWMVSLKGLFGFIEVAAALKFFSNADLVWGLGLLPRPLAVALMIVIFALAGLFLLGRLMLRTPGGEGPGGSVGPFRLVGAIACLGLALYLVPGLLGAPLGAVDAFLPPHRATDVSIVRASASGDAAPMHEGWLQDREAAFVEARRTGRPVLIDFTGYTCTNCRYMEANVLSRPAVAERIRRGFVPLQLWTDDAREGPDHQRYQFELTGWIALPTYAVVTPDGRLAGQISGVTSERNFAAFLDRHAEGEALAAR